MARFPKSDIVALLDQDPTFNLGESTSKDLVLGEILDADLIERLAQVRLGYGSSLGDPALRDEIAESLGVSADQVLVTVGGASALFMISFVLCDPGDEIVVAAPNFPPTLDVMAAVGARLVPLRLDFDTGYRFSIDDLRAALSPATKLVSFATPHNPSGRIFSIADCEAALASMAEVCPDAYLVVDESYREAVYGDVASPPSAAPLSPKVITSASVSKCHGAPGLRIGWLSCLDERLFEQLALAKLNTVLSCSVVDELLALEVLRRKETLFGERRRALATAWTKSPIGWRRRAIWSSGCARTAAPSAASACGRTSTRTPMSTPSSPVSRSTTRWLPRGAGSTIRRGSSGSASGFRHSPCSTTPWPRWRGPSPTRSRRRRRLPSPEKRTPPERGSVENSQVVAG